MFLIFCNHKSDAQATFSAGNYSQNFGTSSVLTWTDNSTFLGWYATSYQITAAGTDPFRATINITAAVPPNAGGWAVYQINGGTDMKLGTRPSNNSGGPDIPGVNGQRGIGLGLCLRNNFGLPIVSISVDFDWYQLSLAENGNNPNVNFLSYFVSSSNLTSADLPNNAHTYTNVVTANYTAPNNSATASSNQISSYPGTVSGHISVCIPVNVPINNYLMLRWWDANNGSNDPHMAIDNVHVTANSDNACTTVLPINLLNFTATSANKNSVDLNWITSSETNNNFFTVERSVNGDPFQAISNVNGSGTSSQQHYYETIDYEPGIGVNYYRLRQTDYNGDTKVSSIVAVNFQQVEKFATWFYAADEVLNYQVNSEENFDLQIMDISGRIIYDEKNIPSGSGKIETRSWSHGVYIVRCSNKWNTISRKIVL